MADDRTKTPSIPDATGADEASAALLRPMKEIIEVREGRRGNPLDRFVTVRDLVDWGLISSEKADG